MKKIIMVLLMSILLLSCGDSQEVQMVKNGTLNIYPNKTLGEAIE